MKVEIQSFGNHQGIEYQEIYVTSPNGTQISFCDLGARINRWGILQSNDTYEQIVLGHQNAAEVFESASYYGATVGRVAGRIKDACFELDGKTYLLEKNNGQNHLHGGLEGFDLCRFDFSIKNEIDYVDVIFSLKDPHDHNGYPGTVKFQVIHRYDKENRWTIKYLATTSEATIFNPTNHVYFNLNGNNLAPITNHHLKVLAEDYLPLNDQNLPSAGPTKVEGTVFDLREGVDLGYLLEQDEPQFAYTRGLDHPFIVKDHSRPQAKLTCKSKGRSVEVTTDQVAIVIYMHGYPVNLEKIWNNPQQPFAGITFETQNLPNAIHDQFAGDTILRPGQSFSAHTTYRLIID